jgi:hypothetical protein
MRRFWAISNLNHPIPPRVTSVLQLSYPLKHPFLSKEANQMHFPQLTFSVTLLAAVAVSALPPFRFVSEPEGHLCGNNTTSFQLQNGLDAQALNFQFQNLTANSPCRPDEQACVGGDFAQCVSGTFVTMPCPANLTCFALPLDNKPGTRYVTHHTLPMAHFWLTYRHSITCDTEADAVSRIADTGAPGGLTGQ